MEEGIIMTNSVSSQPFRKYNVAAFFSGVGGIELGFEQTGEFRVVYANEFDKNARITYKENHPSVFLDGRDIREVRPEDIESDIDIVIGGFPCQAFSIAGYRKGFEDERGDLFFEMFKHIKKKRPRAIFIENVKNMVTHDHGNTFKVIRETLTMNGYFIKWKVLNGKDHGNVPQNRERIYIVGFTSKEAYNKFEFPEKVELTTTIHDIIDFESTKIDDYFYYKKGRQPFYDLLEETIVSQDTIYQWRRQYVRENKSGVVPTLTANMGTGGHNVPLIKADNGIRKLTPRETFNVQGFPQDYILPNISNGQLYKQAGNSVVVPVIKRIAENIAIALENTSDDNWKDADGKYSIMHTNMDGRFEGSSELVAVVDTIEDLEYFSKEHEIEYMSLTDYTKNISKNKKMDFYNFE